ncbi:hypothetical protein Ddye_026210 [Dipteronia dyeriana]|uniref:Glycosyltransferase n=1 Tax=Dipteronia dyeriana TaxID=168575 RepID=A0AAD9WQC0_9ROSI|nr:hypothetical protein Ddye_026210 [Dipteronia dyeriana]
MDPNNLQASAKGNNNVCHIVAIPYPARGHINPMLNLCKLLVSRNSEILITFVVTQEWLGLIGSDAYTKNISFATIPDNIIPSEKNQLDDGITFVTAVMTKLEAPFQRILDRLYPPVTTIITDALLLWAVDTGNRRNIPVAALWISSALTFSICYHCDLFKEKQFPLDLEEHADDVIDFIPGISSIRVADIPSFFHNKQYSIDDRSFKLPVSKAQYFLSTSVFELESQVFNVFKSKFNIPVYSVGPLIPYKSELNCESPTSSCHEEPHYIKWLNSKPISSVLYVSMGSLFKLSRAQLDELVAGVKMSGVRCLRVGRDETCRPQDGFNDLGLVVPWCEQLRVLSHSSVGGFLTHCGWGSVLEAAFVGVPMLALPIMVDHFTISKQIVEDWKIGWRLNKDIRGEHSVITRQEIAKTIHAFMDINSSERKELIKRAKQVEDIFQAAIAKGGSSDTNLDSFNKDITPGQAH